MFRLLIIAILVMLDVMMLVDISERNLILKVNRRIDYVESFEDQRLRYFESHPHKAITIWNIDPMVYFEPDPTTYDL